MKTATIRMNNASNSAEILLYDMIGEDPWFGDGISAKVFSEQITEITKQGVKLINLRINSPGGSVTEGSAMLNALDKFPGRIEVDVDGIAASAASVLMMAGNHVRVASNGLVMIHNPHGRVTGDSAAFRKQADLMDKVKEQIIVAYMRKAKVNKETLSAWMDEETWFNGQEAVDAGLANEVAKPVSLAAFGDLAAYQAKLQYRHVPDVGAAALEVAMEETEKRRRLIESLARTM